MNIDSIQGAALLLVRIVDEVPADDDVTAGTAGAIMFGLLVLATALLMVSFMKQMRKTERAQQAGVFGDDLPEKERVTSVDQSNDDTPAAPTQ